jgi:hypothetical protein
MLLQFVAFFLIERDSKWGECCEVNCSCKDKKHMMIPSHWLASLKTDAWVPSKITENEEEKMVKVTATRDNIGKMLSSSDLEMMMKTNPQKITKLLVHFGFDELDLKIKQQSIERGTSEQQVRKEVSSLMDITNIVTDLPDLVRRNIHAFREAIDKLRERLEFKLIADENRKIGKNLEIAIAEILLGKAGIADVKPIYRGGDLEIWPDKNEGWDSGLIEITPYLVEVKFTSGMRTHLSKAQGEMAKEKKDHYIVLVVENNGGLRERLLTLVVSESPISEELITEVLENSYVVEGINQKLGSVPNPDEIEPDIQGYWIKKRLWDGKLSLLDWIERKFQVR